MPTYDLACDLCGNRFEVFRQRLLRPDERACARCGAATRIVLGSFVTAAPGADQRRTVTVHRIDARSCGCGCRHQG